MSKHDMLSIVVGCLMVAFGFASGRFYPGLIRKREEDEKPLPRWLRV